jgi:preprotein translocase subunit SecY
MRSNVKPSISSKVGALKSKIYFTIICLIIYRLGSYVPIPGIDSIILSKIAEKNASGILGIVNMFSGGSLSRMSIFALAIMPYITASIVFQLLTIVSKSLENLKNEGEIGRKKINQYTKYLTIILATFQAFGISVSLQGMSYSTGSVVVLTGSIFNLLAVITLVTGTMFLMWLGEQITKNGIGNGTSLIIFVGIISGLPNALASFFELGKGGVISTAVIIGVILMLSVMILVVVFIEKAYRKILVQYPKRQVGNKFFAGDVSHMPLKLNTASVIPPIFASAILLFPLTIANFSNANPEGAQGILQLITSYLSHGKPLYVLLYMALIIFFSFFYTSIIFNPNEVSDNLRKYGGIIPGRRPGKHTAEYLDYVLTRLTLIGAFYMAIICAIPEILMSYYSVPFYLGGTSLLIIVNVINDTSNQIQTYLLTQQYEHLMKKAKL